MVGVKPAGGIRTAKDAIKYLVMVNEIAGADWLDPDWFRFGASTLLNDLLMQRTKLHDRPLLRPRLLHPGLSAMANAFEYAPAPESRVDRRHQVRRTACSSTASSSTATAQPFKTINPATEEVLAEVAEADEADVDRGRQGRPPRLRHGSGRGCRAASAAKYLFRIARIIQERARELAVLESLDNGKPIKESRDVDIPLVAAHFFYYAGWADKLEYAGFGADPQPLGVAGQVIPWNFPLLMLAWKIAPALACGNTVVLKPAETTPLTALLFAEICQQADLPPGVVNIVTGAGDDRPRAGRAPRRRQGRLHRLDRGRPGDRRSRRRHRQEGHPRARRQGRQHRLRRRADRPGRRGHRQRHLLQPGPRLLRRLAAAGAGVGRRRGARRGSSAGWRTLRVGDPLDKNTDIGAINSAEQLARIRELVRRSARPRAPSAGRRRASCPTTASGSPPTVFTGVTQAHRIAREEIFGPVLSVLTFRTPAEAVEKANNTPYGLSAGVWTDKGSRILWMADQLRAGVVWANTFNKFDPTSAVRRLQGVGLRPRGRPARAGGLPCRLSTPDAGSTSARPTSSTSAARSRARSPAGPTSCTDAKGEFLANAALASRKDARDAVVAARKAFAGWSGATAYNRGQVALPGRRGAGGPPRAVRRRGRAPAEGGRPRQAAGRRGRGDRPLVWYAGWADKIAQVVGGANPVAGPVLQLLRARADRRRRRGRPAGLVAARPGQRGRPGRSSPATRWSWSPRRARPLPAITLAEVLATSDVPGGVVNVLTGRARRDRAVAGRRTWTSTRIDLTGVADAELAADLEVAAAENLKRVLRAPAAEPDWTAEPGLDRMTRVPGDQDGLAPDRGLTARWGSYAVVAARQPQRPAVRRDAAHVRGAAARDRPGVDDPVAWRARRR